MINKECTFDFIQCLTEFGVYLLLRGSVEIWAGYVGKYEQREAFEHFQQMREEYA